MATHNLDDAHPTSERSMSRPTRGRGWGVFVVGAIVAGCSPSLTEISESGGSTGMPVVTTTGPFAQSRQYFGHDDVERDGRVGGERRR